MKDASAKWFNEVLANSVDKKEKWLTTMAESAVGNFLLEHLPSKWERVEPIGKIHQLAWKTYRGVSGEKHKYMLYEHRDPNLQRFVFISVFSDYGQYMNKLIPNVGDLEKILLEFIGSIDSVLSKWEEEYIKRKEEKNAEE